MANIVRNYFRLGPPTGNRDGTGVYGARAGAAKRSRSTGRTHAWAGITGFRVFRTDRVPRARAAPAEYVMHVRSGGRIMG